MSREENTPERFRPVATPPAPAGRNRNPSHRPWLGGGLLGTVSDSTDDIRWHLLHGMGPPVITGGPEQGAPDRDPGMSARPNGHGAQGDSRGARASTVRLRPVPRPPRVLNTISQNRALPAQVSFKGNFVYVKEASRIKGNY